MNKLGHIEDVKFIVSSAEYPDLIVVVRARRINEFWECDAEKIPQLVMHALKDSLTKAILKKDPDTFDLWDGSAFDLNIGDLASNGIPLLVRSFLYADHDITIELMDTELFVTKDWDYDNVLVDRSQLETVEDNADATI